MGADLANTQAREADKAKNTLKRQVRNLSSASAILLQSKRPATQSANMGSSSPSFKTAIITGGASGIGLAEVRHLLDKPTPKWRVVIADINTAAYETVKMSLDPDRHIFVETDVASWESQASLFVKAYEWSGQRVDFFFANAGIPDRENVYQPFDLAAPPEKPNLACIEVNLLGVFYGLKLFIHYTRKTRSNLAASANGANPETPFHPKMVITASCVGIYPFELAPQYAASKAGLVNLTRSAAPPLYRHDNIGLNCLMPAFIATPILPKELIDIWPREWITLTSTLCRVLDECISESGEVEQDGKSDGKNGDVKVGQTVEGVLDRLYYREHTSFADESQEFCCKEATEDGIWGKVFKERIRLATMAAQGQQETAKPT